MGEMYRAGEMGSEMGPSATMFGADDDDRTQVVSPDLPSPTLPTLDLPNYLGVLDQSDYEKASVDAMTDPDFDPLASSGRAGASRPQIESFLETGHRYSPFGHDDFYGHHGPAAVIGEELGPMHFIRG